MTRAFHFIAFCALSIPLHAQKKGELPERTEAEILKTVTLPEGYAATVFARPPQGGYPTSVSAAVDGTIFVAIDENGSLGRDRNTTEKKPGKVVRMRDTDGDGRADEFKIFAEMESPRGVIWDGPSGTAPGTLYVMHPPNLTAYTDTDGDGKADKQEDILTGLGFDLDFRGADHTTNGCRLAIDGFIYIAVGDYGFINAKAKDGTTLTNRGGGIVRIRPDGTRFEIVSRGQRNIYDVAVSPTLELFTRDNTNDGGGWNVRLSFVPPGAHMGYPYLFRNFPEDMLQPLADLGGGSPCGALWLDEPGLPKGLFTVEWGVGGIMYHDDLMRDGAGWKVGAPEGDPASANWKRPTVRQNKWIAMTRPTDMDVDASGALFITSWEGATFNYNGPYAGYVLRVVKKDAPKVAVPDFAKAPLRELLRLTGEPSGTIRLTAQRELVRRLRANPDADGRLVQDAVTLAYERAAKGDLAGGYAAFYVLNLGAPSDTAIRIPDSVWDKAGSAARLLVVHAFGDDPRERSYFDFLFRALRDKDPRVRAAAITTLRRLPDINPASAIIELVADKDPVIAHLAVRALSELKAVDTCLSALDTSAYAEMHPGALRALYGIYDPEVVDGLISRLERGAHAPSRAVSGASPETSNVARPDNPETTPPGSAVSPAGAPETARDARALPISTAKTTPAPKPDDSFNLHRGILNALCRLANQDAPYEDPKVWWGTRPDTSGPVYQPIPWSQTGKITAALKRAVEKSDADDAKWLVQRMYATKVNFPGLVELMLAKAGSDTPAKLEAIEGMVRADNSLPAEGIAALQGIATNDNEASELRVRALRLFQRCAENGAVFPGAVAAFAPLAGHDLSDPKLTAAFEDFTRGAHNGKWVGEYRKHLTGKDASRRQLAATVLVNLSTSRVGKDKDRDEAKKAVEKAFEQPEPAAALLAAIARTGAKAYADQVKANLNNPNNAVAEAALFAFQKLGLKDTGAPAQMIATMKYEDVFAAVQKGGDAKAGQDMFLKAGCIACHTVGADEPPKGPVLSAVAKIYDRAALTESVLKPSAKIAQGFESTWIKTKKGEQLEGFVTREGGDSLDLRNVAGQVVLVEKADIADRGHRPQSMMPEGLLNAFTPADLANLLAWLESLKK